MKKFLFLTFFLNIGVHAEMSPEESRASDYIMIEQNMELRRKLSASFYDDIVKIENDTGTFYTVLKRKCLAIVQIGKIDEKKPMPGSSKRIIKDIKGPICFWK